MDARRRLLLKEWLVQVGERWGEGRLAFSSIAGTMTGFIYIIGVHQIETTVPKHLRVSWSSVLCTQKMEYTTITSRNTDTTLYSYWYTPMITVENKDN